MKPYALINLITLRVVQFDREEEWRDAMEAFHKREIGFVALKYSEAANSYYLPEIVI